MSDTEVTMQDRADLVEAHIRQHMAQHAAITPRGFDTIRQRAIIHAEIDRLLDAWMLLAAVADMDTPVPT